MFMIYMAYYQPLTVCAVDNMALFFFGCAIFIRKVQGSRFVLKGLVCCYVVRRYDVIGGA